MNIVSQKDYLLLKKQIKEAPTFVFSILDCKIGGTVYTSCASLESIFIKSNAGLYYVTGSTGNAAFMERIAAVFDEAAAKNERFTLFSYSEEWNRIVENALGNRIRKIERYAFTFEQAAYRNRKTNTARPYQAEKITRTHIEQSKEFDEDYYNEYWDSIDNFLQHGVGFVLKEKNQIISEGVSIFASIDYAEIDIITDANYRGKGLAFFVAEQFIDHCLSHNIQPCWECNTDNIASVQLARKLGFTEPRTYTVYAKK